MADRSALTVVVEAGNRAEAVRLTQAAVDEGVGPDEILDGIFGWYPEYVRQGIRKQPIDLLRHVAVEGPETSFEMRYEWAAKTGRI